MEIGLSSEVQGKHLTVTFSQLQVVLYQSCLVPARGSVFCEAPNKAVN